MLSKKWNAAFFLLFMLLYAPVCIKAAEAVKSETLLRTGSSWDGADYKSYPAGPPELSVVKITIPPHTKMELHTHPMPNVGYVLSGDITVEKKNGVKRHVSAGQVLPETVDTVHRGVTGDAAAVFIVFYAGAKGLLLSQPEKH